jgi:hypothetical protein
VVVFLPTKSGVERHTAVRDFERIESVLKLSAGALRINENLKSEVVRRLEQAGVHTVDFWDEMRESATEFFWRRDHHLNVNGHQFVAEKIYETLRAGISRREAASPAADE